jgi:hypothetical protein
LPKNEIFASHGMNEHERLQVVFWHFQKVKPISIKNRFSRSTIISSFLLLCVAATESAKVHSTLFARGVAVSRSSLSVEAFKSLSRSRVTR